MGNFKRFSGGDSRNGGGRPGGRGGFGGPRRDGERPEMFRATCAKCGNSCEVPFRPTGERPVYCSDCFGAQRGDSHGARPERRDFAPRAPQFGGGDVKMDELKRKIESLESKLDKALGLLEGLRRNKDEEEAVKTRKPMATPEFYKNLEKIESDIKSKKKTEKKPAPKKKK